MAGRAPDAEPGDAASDAGAEAAQRIDLWLWCARFRKTRADCARLVTEGSVRLNRRPIEKASARVRSGDVLTVAVGGGMRPDGSPGGSIRVIRIRSLAARRGPAPEARTLYDEVPPG